MLSHPLVLYGLLTPRQSETIIMLMVIVHEAKKT